MATNSYFDDFKQKYERPQVNGLIVGFSGIDPQRKSSGSGDSCNYDNTTLSNEQKDIVRQIIREALSVVDFSDCSCDPSQLSDEQKHIISMLIEQKLEELNICECDYSNLSDEQKSIVRSIIDERISEFIINYDGGEIHYDDKQHDPEPVPIDASDLNHEQLNGLLGGEASGHYHMTQEELLKLASYPSFSEIKHENLQDLLGGNANGHHHLTDDELNKLRIMIDTFFPDGSDHVIITPVSPVIPDNNDTPLDEFDPYGGLPSGTPPAWELRMLPSGFECYEGVNKMYYGTTPGDGTPALIVQLYRSSTGKHVGQQTTELHTWKNSSLNANNTRNFYSYYYSNVRKSIYYAGEPAVSSSNGGGYRSSTASGSVSASNGYFNSLCFSDLLQVLLMATNKGEVRLLTIVSNSHSSSNAYNAHLTVNPGCAAWHPTTAVFCLTGLEGTSTSFDGENWTLNSNAPHNLLELTYREDLGVFFARSGEDKTFYSSADGIHWHQVSDSPIPLDHITTVLYEPSLQWYCAVGLGDGNAYFSKDLKHWIPTKLRNNSPVDVADVIFMPSTGLYVAMPTSGTYYYTFNPSKWTD